nr:hypothetical protein CFP56_28830 [Quercus suber]
MSQEAKVGGGLSRRRGWGTRKCASVCIGRITSSRDEGNNGNHGKSEISLATSGSVVVQRRVASSTVHTVSDDLPASTSRPLIRSARDDLSKRTERRAAAPRVEPPARGPAAWTRPLPESKPVQSRASEVHYLTPLRFQP